MKADECSTSTYGKLRVAGLPWGGCRQPLWGLLRGRGLRPQASGHRTQCPRFHPAEVCKVSPSLFGPACILNFYSSCCYMLSKAHEEWKAP